MVLFIANVASLLFWAAPVAKIIFITFILCSVAKSVLYIFFGFEKILAIAHVFWIYLVPFVLLSALSYEGIFLAYLLVLALLLTTALVLDVKDVWKYFRTMGE